MTTETELRALEAENQWLREQISGQLSELRDYAKDVTALREQVERQQSRIDSCNAMLDKHDEFFLYINEVLELYGNTHTYKAERTGGVLAGCPRGKSPKPEHLVFEARHAIKRLFEMCGKPVPDWVSDYKESLFVKVERLERELSAAEDVCKSLSKQCVAEAQEIGKAYKGLLAIKDVEL